MRRVSQSHSSDIFQVTESCTNDGQNCLLVAGRNNAAILVWWKTI